MIRKLYRWLVDQLDPVDLALSQPVKPQDAPLERTTSYAASGARVRVNPGCGGRYDQDKAVAKKEAALVRDAELRKIAAQVPTVKAKKAKDNIAEMPARKTGTRG